MSNASRPDVATAHCPWLLGLALQDVASVPRTRDGRPTETDREKRSRRAAGPLRARLKCQRAFRRPGAPAPRSASRRPAAYGVPGRATVLTSSCPKTHSEAYPLWCPRVSPTCAIRLNPTHCKLLWRVDRRGVDPGVARGGP
eukprot:scaffold58169_cov68-Phaeocystis_antarctica.AAC.6